MSFEFLKSIQPIVVEQEVKVKKIREKVSKNPEGMRLRIYKDGSVYPSQELIEQFNLEYMTKLPENTVSGHTNNGFDVFSSKDWGQYPKEAQQVVFIAAVPKSEAKVSVFGSVDYNEDGTPKKSVMNQGSKRPEIVEMLREVYDKPFTPLYETLERYVAEEDLLFGSKNYVDLDINTEVKVFEGLSKYFIPKKIVKGTRVGQMSYEERTGLNIFPLTIAGEVVENTVEEQVLEEVNN